jgi:putative lipoic acid-binding regulatory protein
LRDAVARVLGDRDYTFSLSNQSSRGKYLSFHVELVVRDEEERIELFAALRDHPDIVIVL